MHKERKYNIADIVTKVYFKCRKTQDLVIIHTKAALK